jgi:hypothetical protein
VILSSALRNDVAHRSGDPAVKEATNHLMGLLTPVIKGVLTDRGFANAVSAQQMYGGHGYIVETGVEQFVRDVRITPLYEGANGIQALDLVARKLPRDNWRAIRAFIGEIDRFIEENGGQERLAPAVVELQDATSDLKKATAARTKLAMKDPNDAIAGSTDYMHLLGRVALG